MPGSRLSSCSCMASLLEFSAACSAVGRLSLRAKAALGRQIVSGVEHLHHTGLLHCK